MTAPRRKARRRGALFPSAERLHVQLAKIEALQGQRGQRLFVFMPVHAEQQPATFAEGEGPQRGDLVIAFEPLHATADEAAMTVEQLRERYCQRTDLGTRPPAWEPSAHAMTGHRATRRAQTSRTSRRRPSTPTSSSAPNSG